jgi:hypothetical protein
MALLASSDLLTDSLQPVLTSLGPSTISRPSDAAKRPPHVSSSRFSSASPQCCAWLGRRRRRGRGRGSKHLATEGTGCKVQSPGSTSVDLTDVEELAKSADRAAKSRNQTTRENSATTENGSRHSFSVHCVRGTPSVCAPSPSGGAEPAIHSLSPRDSIMSDPTTSQLNLNPATAPYVLEYPPKPRYRPSVESHSYLSGLEGSTSGIKFLGDIEQVLYGHFSEFDAWFVRLIHKFMS